jgi:hypothetical protein
MQKTEPDLTVINVYSELSDGACNPACGSSLINIKNFIQANFFIYTVYTNSYLFRLNDTEQYDIITYNPVASRNAYIFFFTISTRFQRDHSAIG